MSDYIHTFKADVNGERRLFKVRAANDERVIYDVEFPYGNDGNLTAPPKENLCMTRAGFAERTGWSPK